MRISACKWTNVIVTGLMLAWGAAAYAQQPAPRGSVNVRSPFFNPFDVGVSRLQLDMFGSFEIGQSTASLPDSTLAAGSSSSATTSKGGDQALVAMGKVRSPKKPPKPRSPHKPPHPHDPPGPPHDPPGPPSDPPPVDPPGRR